jgi:hypothetical protein
VHPTLAYAALKLAQTEIDSVSFLQHCPVILVRLRRSEEAIASTRATDQTCYAVRNAGKSSGLITKEFSTPAFNLGQLLVFGSIESETERGKEVAS